MESIERKVKYVIGKDSWHLNSDKFVQLTDGPHGVRAEKDDGREGVMKASHVANCFPSACLTSCSFSEESLFKLGQTLGNASKGYKTNVLLGPGINIKRNPLCGRNFEYMSEDPYLTGKLASSYINGLQSQGVGASLKHYALNNQETLRTSINSVVDERALREIYLNAFERAIKESQPWTIMASYNMLNETYACENKYLLTDLGRNEFKFEGLYVSDWGAVNDLEKSLAAGLDLEMAYSELDLKRGIKYYNEHQDEIVNLDRAVNNVKKLIEKAGSFDEKIDLDYGHQIAKDIALDSIVLLRNENKILPLKKDEKVLLVGQFAVTPRYQGGGSSHINSYKVTSMLGLINENFSYLPGFNLDGSENKEELEKVIQKAKEVDKVILFLGLTGEEESEGFDRPHMKLHENQIELVNEIYKVNKNIIVVLENGSAIEMPFIDKTKAIVECYLGGEAINEALFDILIGKVSPSGRLSETFAKTYGDYPSSKYYLDDEWNAKYKESIFVGYRYLADRPDRVNYMFGHGLSYSSFELFNFKTKKNGQTIEIKFDVKNVGEMEAKEVIEVFISKPNEILFNPKYELRKFAKINLKPQETKEVIVRLDEEDFASYDIKKKYFTVKKGSYNISIGETMSNFAYQQSFTLGIDEDVVYEKAKVLDYFKHDLSSLSDKEFACLFKEQKLPLVSEKKVGEYDKNTSATIAKKDSKGAQKLVEFLMTTPLSKRPSLLKVLLDLPIRSIGNNFGLKDEVLIQAFIDLFNDKNIEVNLKIVTEIFIKVISSFKK